MTSPLPPGQCCSEKVHFQPADSTLIGGRGRGRGKSKRERFQRKSACVPTVLSRIVAHLHTNKTHPLKSTNWTSSQWIQSQVSLHVVLKYVFRVRPAGAFDAYVSSSPQLCNSSRWWLENCVLRWAHLWNGPIRQEGHLGLAAEAQDRTDHNPHHPLHVSTLFLVWPGRYPGSSPWLFIAYSDERRIYYQFPLLAYTFYRWKVGRMCFLSLGVKGLNVVRFSQGWGRLSRRSDCDHGRRAAAMLWELLVPKEQVGTLRLNERMNEWMDVWIDGLMYERMDEWMDGWVNEWMKNVINVSVRFCADALIGNTT